MCVGVVTKPTGSVSRNYIVSTSFSARREGWLVESVDCVLVSGKSHLWEAAPLTSSVGQPIPDPFCDANFVPIARSFPRYKFLRPPRLSPSDIRFHAKYLNTCLTETDNWKLATTIVFKAGYAVV